MNAENLTVADDTGWLALLLGRTNRMSNVILRLTHRVWNREISRLLCRAYERGVINSQQLHTLAGMFDPTQDHAVGRK